VRVDHLVRQRVRQLIPPELSTQVMPRLARLVPRQLGRTVAGLGQRVAGRAHQLVPQRFHRVAREAVAFGLIGLFNTVLDFGGYNALLFLGALKANLISTSVATATSYLMNRRWTYHDRPRTAVRREFSLFFAFNLAGLMIQEAILFLAKYGLGFHEDNRLVLNLFKCAGVGVAMVFRFWAYRTFVFARPVDGGVVAPLSPAEVEAEPDDLDRELTELEFAELTVSLEQDLTEWPSLELDDEAPQSPARRPR
jgi:putative flippase GtrA